MVKGHNWLVEITNDTPFLMTYRRDWYDCGRVADGFSWPRVIEANGSGKVLSYEKDWATMIGWSGYVTYDINNTEVTIAFENPYTGANKLGVCTGEVGEESVWKRMDKHGYKEFTETMALVVLLQVYRWRHQHLYCQPEKIIGEK